MMSSQQFILTITANEAATALRMKAQSMRPSHEKAQVLRLAGLMMPTAGNGKSVAARVANDHKTIDHARRAALLCIQADVAYMRLNSEIVFFDGSVLAS